MTDEDKKYITKTGKMRPSLEVFEEMAMILKRAHENTDKLMEALSNFLIKPTSSS